MWHIILTKIQTGDRESPGKPGKNMTSFYKGKKLCELQAAFDHRIESRLWSPLTTNGLNYFYNQPNCNLSTDNWLYDMKNHPQIQSTRREGAQKSKTRNLKNQDF